VHLRHQLVHDISVARLRLHLFDLIDVINEDDGLRQLTDLQH
jgi:hypothetical protein